jgi:hypothetical protein
MLVWALTWSQQHGIPVLPCKPDKSPLVAGGKDSATLDPAQIRQWWEQWPGALIGGRADGLVVLDFDAYKPGHTQDVADLPDDLPSTREFSTPGANGVRGRHLVYLDPGGQCRSTKLGASRTIDVRAGTSRDYVILPPSRNGHGKPYAVEDWRPPVLAPTWLRELAGDRPEAAEIPDGLPALADLPDPMPPELVRALANNNGDRSAHTQHVAYAGAQYGLADGQILALLEADLTTQARRSEVKRNSPTWWPGEFARVLAIARAKYPGPVPVPDGEIRPMVRALIDQIRSYQFMPDPGRVLATLAVAATSQLEGEPAWLLLVGPSSSGKTSTIGLLDAHILDYTSEAGLLSWAVPPKKGELAVPAGLLAEIGNSKRSLVAIPDLSTLMRSDRTNHASNLWSAMRRIYDGHYFRDVSAPGGRATPGRLEWHGRFTMVGAVTRKIDQYIENNELGPRWIYYRLPPVSDEDQAEMSRMLLVPDRADKAREARRQALEVLALARQEAGAVELPGWLPTWCQDVARVTCLGRASVNWHTTGNRHGLAGEPDIEDSPRVTAELLQLARGLYALGCTSARVMFLLRKVALDSMPALRLKVLRVLSACKPDDPLRGPTTYRVIKMAGIDRHTGRRILDELELIGLVQGEAAARSKTELLRSGGVDVTPDPEGADEADRRVMQWCLSGPRGALAYQVIKDDERGVL